MRDMKQSMLAICAPGPDYNGPEVVASPAKANKRQVEPCGVAFESLGARLRAPKDGDALLAGTPPAAAGAGAGGPEGPAPSPAPAAHQVDVAGAMDASHDNYYALLGLGGLGCDATDEQIKKAYRKMMLKLHPDKQRGNKRTGHDDPQFVAVQKAFATLSDPTKRRDYDSQFEFDESIPSADDEFDDFVEFADVYAPVFRRNARFSTKKPVPQLGTEATAWKDVEAFYKFWFTFETWREIEGEEEHDVDDAQDRMERRWMERQNAAKRSKLKKKEVRRIHRLVERAFAKDPRVKAHDQAEKERKQAEKEERQRRRDAAEAARKAKEEAEAKARAEAEAKAKEQRKATKARRKAAKQGFRRICQPFVEMPSADCRLNVTAVDLACQHLPWEELETALERLGELKDLETLKTELLAMTDEVRSNHKASSAAVAAAAERERASKKQEKQQTVAWLPEELSMLAKAVSKFPRGTKQRWEQIAEFVNRLALAHTRSADECISQAAKVGGKFQATAKVVAKENLPQPAAQGAAAGGGAAAAAAAPAPEADAWSPDQQKALEAALREFPASMDKNERWRSIAAAVPGRTKKECVQRFKALRAQLKAAKASTAK